MSAFEESDPDSPQPASTPTTPAEIPALSDTVAVM